MKLGVYNRIFGTLDPKSVSHSIGMEDFQSSSTHCLSRRISTIMSGALIEDLFVVVSIELIPNLSTHQSNVPKGTQIYQLSVHMSSLLRNNIFGLISNFQIYLIFVLISGHLSARRIFLYFWRVARRSVEIRLSQVG
jgi:hypothetical protein